MTLINSKTYYMLKSIFKGTALTAIAAAALIYGCKKDDKGSLGTKPTAAFKVVGGGDSNSVQAINTTSTPSISYWEVQGTKGIIKGDTANVRFSFAGTYSLTLIANGAGGIDSITQQVTINQNDPKACDGTLLGFLTSCGSQNWKLAPIASAEGVGPAMGNTTWWGNGAAEPTGDRVCDWDDVWTFDFNASMTMEYNNNGTFYSNGAEGNLGIGGASVCDVNSDLPANQAAWASGNFNYSISNGTGVNSLGQITLIGTGAHIGLPEEANNTTISSASVSSVTYDVVSMTSGVLDASNVAHNQLVLGILVGGGVYWTWTLWSY